MPRPKSQTREIIVARAMTCFWKQGYEATSIDVLVRQIGISRHELYSSFGGKEGLFLTCLQAYRQEIVKPAFTQVEDKHATLEAISRYFEFQISKGEAAGFPGSGCLIGNALTEIAPHNLKVATVVGAHNSQLSAGFQNAIANTAETLAAKLKMQDTETLATVLVVFANGLWSMSRAITSAAPLRSAVREQLSFIKKRIQQ